jgi:uncharacterized protein
MYENRFEWDDAKAGSNLTKHGVSFETACCVFDDAFAFDRFDLDKEPGEIRYVITGTVNGVTLSVVYTEREDRIRNNLSKKSHKE